MASEARRDRLERLTNLVLVLLDASRPLSLREITDRVEGYPETKEAIRQAFERDKRALRDLGIPLASVPIDGHDQVGYQIDEDEYYLPDLELDEAEATALAFAVAAVQLGGSAGRDALSTLGHGVDQVPAPVAVLPSVPFLAVVHDAVRDRAELRFGYHGRERRVEPYALSFRRAAWYLVGRDLTADGPSGQVRTFRLDRFESEPAAGEPGGFEPPGDLDLASEIQLLPFAADGAEDLPVADLEIDGRLAHQVAALVPDSAVSAWGEHGSVRLSLPVGDVAAFTSFVAGLGDAAVVHGPASLREAVVERLRAVAAAVPPPRAAEPPATAGAPVRPRPQPPTTLVAGERLRRLLALLVHLARVKEASLPELARQFQMSEDELVHDLELAACCGVPPYTPDQLIELIVEGDRVLAYGLGHLARPRRLTPQEGFALAAAAAALGQVPGAGDEPALASALAKLERVLGEQQFSVELDPPEFVAPLREAVGRHESVEIDYVSSSAPTETTRTVDPYQVVLREGRFYLDGWCHRAGGLRRFAVDRILAVRPTGTVFEPPATLDESLASPAAFLGGPDVVTVRLAFPAGSELGVEQLATSTLERLEDGRLVADLRVGDVEGFLGRLLLRLGPGSEVLAPDSLRDAAARAAARALARYEGVGDAVPGEPGA